MTNPKITEPHGSRIITALEHAWAAIQDAHPDVPDVVIVTGAGSNQKGTPEGYQLRGHHWPERWVLGGQDQPRAPELFVAGELLAAGGRAVIEVMLHEAAHALAARRGIKDTSAAGNRYHNKRFVTLAAELGLRGPEVPDKITGWSHCTLHGQAAYEAWAGVTAAIDAARLPFLIDLARPARPGGGDGTGGDGQDQGDGEDGQPAKRGGRRVAVECGCQPEPRRLQLTPKQIEDGPITCGLCSAPFEQPEDSSGQR
ncbi:MAG TPA: hypothetical protein VGI00_16520 [Streptosporangiaceae bacterium]|jgi:hypothetical protein